ncbi:MAG TPA: thiamine pyrophosphate-binding protein [Geminicoccaceae bacterium]|nr:thiamine pyrophosphate-binding protein [Geminicoccaceae bacterium]
MSKRTGRHALIEQFLADDMSHMFGNPGTVEQGFLDTLAEYPAMKYILTLHETVAVMAADAYARATRRPALVQIHSTPGLGNAIGALYQAKRGHAPLVVIGGDAGVRYLAMDAQMAGDLVAFARPVTKWATMVAHPSSLLRVIRRAIKIAATPPMGPVYVCLPMDVLDEPAEEDVVPTSIPSSRAAPDPALIREAAEMLASAETPMIFMGDGVAYSGAQDELARVAELLGAEVWGVDSGELNMSYTHPLYQGQTGHMFGAQSLPITRRGDVNLICGTYMVPEVFPELGNIFGPGARTIHFDLDGYEIAKNHPVDLGVISDPKLSLAALADALEETLPADGMAAAAARAERLGAARRAKREAELEADVAAGESHPLRFATFAAELAKHVPTDAVIYDEALTNSPALTRHLPPTRPGRFFQIRGGSLGSGLAGGIGLKAAFPDKPVIVVAGDGASMYTIQALWSAARHNLAVKFIVCNNGSYRLLQVNISQYWRERGIPEHDFPLSFDLSEPALRFDRMAGAMGVAATRVETADQIAGAIEEALAHPGPYLIDVVLEGDVHPGLIGVRCGQ